MRFLTAGAVFVAGAVGVELVGGMLDQIRGKDNLISCCSIRPKRRLEMLGVVLFIRALIMYGVVQFQAVRCRWVTSTAGDEVTAGRR